MVRRLWIVILDAIWRGRVERYFEVCLDLGIIGREDAMARVGGLAMDCLAALWSLDPGLPCSSSV